MLCIQQRFSSPQLLWYEAGTKKIFFFVQTSSTAYGTCPYHGKLDRILSQDLSTTANKAAVPEMDSDEESEKLVNSCYARVVPNTRSIRRPRQAAGYPAAQTHTKKTFLLVTLESQPYWLLQLKTRHQRSGWSLVFPSGQCHPGKMWSTPFFISPLSPGRLRQRIEGGKYYIKKIYLPPSHISIYIDL